MTETNIVRRRERSGTETQEKFEMMVKRVRLYRA